jgi:hypothetical protein
MAKIQFTDSVSLSTNVLSYGEEYKAMRPLLRGVGGAGTTIRLGNNHALIAGHTYEVEALFRTCGDGNSTSSKCSSVGFITWWNNWQEAYSSIHTSPTAYQERGRFSRLFYRFTASKNVQPSGTDLYLIINNGWACGSDNQTIDLYYYRYQDMTDPSIKDEQGINARIFDVYDTKTGKFYYNFLYDINYVNKVLITGNRSNGATFQDYVMDFLIKPVNNGDISGINTLSEARQSFAVGQIQKYPVTSVGNLTITIEGNSKLTQSFSATFYDDYENYDYVYRTEYNPFGPDWTYTRRARQTIGHTRSTSSDVSSVIYVFKNDELVATVNSNETRTLTYPGVVPGDCFYIKNVFKNSGGLVYTRSTYGSYKSMDAISSGITYGGWNDGKYSYGISYDYPEDIGNYMMSQGTVDSYIRNGNTSYGYVIYAGDSTRSKSGLGSTGTGLISNNITVAFSSPNNYDEFINILRSHQ